MYSFETRHCFIKNKKQTHELVWVGITKGTESDFHRVWSQIEALFQSSTVSYGAISLSDQVPKDVDRVVQILSQKKRAPSLVVIQEPVAVLYFQRNVFLSEIQSLDSYGMPEEYFEQIINRLREQRSHFIIEAKSFHISKASTKVIEEFGYEEKGESVVGLGGNFVRCPTLDSTLSYLHTAKNTEADIEAMLQKAIGHMQQSDLYDAIILLRTVLTKKPELVDVWYAKAMAEIELHLHHDAYDSLQSLIKHDPHHGPALEVIRLMQRGV